MSVPAIVPAKLLATLLFTVKLAAAPVSFIVPRVLPLLSDIPATVCAFPFRSKVEPAPDTVRVVPVARALAMPFLMVPAVIDVVPV